MRRVLSFVLLLAFSFPLILPALALAQGPDANLPLCCRRNGKHHCAMMMRGTMASSSSIALSAIPEHCPSYPALITPLRHVELAGPTASAGFAEIISPPAIRPQIAARARLALECAHHKRGPPSDLL